jgi:hypothetical protein
MKMFQQVEVRSFQLAFVPLLVAQRDVILSLP